MMKPVPVISDAEAQMPKGFPGSMLNAVSQTTTSGGALYGHAIWVRESNICSVGGLKLLIRILVESAVLSALEPDHSNHLQDAE